MLILSLLLGMKFLELGSGLIVDTRQLDKAPNKKRRRHSKPKRGVGVRGMSTVDELQSADCNSNNVDASYTSTASDQQEFIQDNSDYQWFVEYGYREVRNERSVVSSCYDELARDLDSVLAQVDMEDYSAHQILSTLPTICSHELQSERQGEMFASVSGSLMVKFEFDSSISPHTSSQDESSMSLCQSEPLFSPVKEVPVLPTNYSVDSLDCEDLMLTCQANKHNYTIAFHGSTVMGDTSEYTDTGGSMCSGECVKRANKMTASDAPTTTWSKLQGRPRHRAKTTSLPDLAPKLSTSLALGGCVKLFDIQNSSSVTSESYTGSSDTPRGGSLLTSAQKGASFSLLRLFIAQRNQQDNTLDNVNRGKVRNRNELSSLSERVWLDEVSACYEDSLVREEPQSSSVERITSKSVSLCSSLSSNRFNNNNNSFGEEVVGGRGTANARVGTASGGDEELSDATSSSDQTHTRLPNPNAGGLPPHSVDRSMQTSALSKQDGGDEGKRPVYVLYPSYTLPDLGFLRDNRVEVEEVLLAPLKYAAQPHPPTPPSALAPTHPAITKRDIDLLKQKGLSHVLDWSSLTPLLPSEYWSLLAELPQVRQHSDLRIERPAFATTPVSACHQHNTSLSDGRTTQNVNSSGCSTGTAPSSGYRGSSTLLNESGSGNTANPLYVYNYSTEEKVKSRLKETQQENKRFSMFELGGLENLLDDPNDTARKRKSLPSQNKEGWDEWWRAGSPPLKHALRLDHLLELSDSDTLHSQDIRQLRDQVSKYLVEAGKKCVTFEGDQLTPPNSPTSIKNYQCKHPGLTLSPQDEPRRNKTEIIDKKSLVDSVREAVERVVREGQEAQVVLDSLCPSLYALLSDELKPQLETPFGPIPNSVWHVVEASAQQGVMTKALNDLVTKLNTEDVLSEGLIKFNAFIFGLLNVKGVEAWVSYMLRRESVLRRHYNDGAVLVGGCRGHPPSRQLTDLLVKSLRPLAKLDFSLDLLYETRQLHQSLLQLTKLPLSPNQNIEVNTDSLLLRKIVQSIRNATLSGEEQIHNQSEGAKNSGNNTRPRSCVDAVAGGDPASTARKRWSGVQVGSRLANAFDKLQDSLEVGEVDSNGEGKREVGADGNPTAEGVAPHQAGKFRSLQRKWELLSGRTESPDLSPVKSSGGSAIGRSRIPRPVTSPPGAANGSRKGLGAPGSRRVSRLDEGETVGLRKGLSPRPSSLPYRAPVSSLTRPAQRRAASSSTSRRHHPPPPSSSPSSNTPHNRYVVTVRHRLPSDSGHLAFNEGERLRLVLEVDHTWLLCCRGDAKGLVPRSAVI